MAVNIIVQDMKKFKFSPTGKYFVIAANMELDTIHIYDSSNIEILLPEKVEKDLFLSELRHSDIKEM